MRDSITRTSTRQVAGKSPTCRRLVRDIPETSPTSHRRLGEASDKRQAPETSPTQVAATPGFPCGVEVYYNMDNTEDES